jgi:hypothetical protein
MRTSRGGALAMTLLMLAALVAASSGNAAWVIQVAAGSKGEAKAAAAPAVPTGVSAVCTSPTARTVKVTWTAVVRASTYTIWRSSTSATTGFTAVATGVTGTTWTSGTLTAASYWFQVSAVTGTNWSGSNSSSTATRVITAATCS